LPISKSLATKREQPPMAMEVRDWKFIKSSPYTIEVLTSCESKESKHYFKTIKKVSVMLAGEETFVVEVVVSAS
jgi:hypothetical protein